MLLSILFLTLACNKVEPVEPQNVITLEWQEGQSFYISASKKQIANMTEESVVSLEDYNPNDALSESWSDEVIWTYKITETHILPATNDSLYDFSLSASGVQKELTVIKAFIDPTLNGDPSILELDPVVYLVFRSDNNRLVGMVQFSTVNNERIEEALSITDGNLSTSILSQSNLSLAPTYLAPFGARWETATLSTETGGYLYSERVDTNTTDVTFRDEMGGELVTARYEKGAPWPTEIVSENLDAYVLSDEDVRSIRENVPMLVDEPEDFDFRSALSSAVNLSHAIHLNPDWISELTDNHDKILEETWTAREGYRPWAGDFWPLKKGELVFGYADTRDTYSNLLKPDIDPLKEKMDGLSDEIRELRKEDDQTDDIKNQIEDKRKEYTDTQEELVEKLIEFYSKIRSDLDGGIITIKDGYLKKEADEENHIDSWNYEINALSPMDKMALAEYLSDSEYHNPFYLPAWEILNSYNPAGATWWGHCNGWAAAAILTNEPREPITYSIDDRDIEFTTADVKGLLTESHYSTHSHFYGERYNGEEDDLTDLSPENFHKLVTHYLYQKEIPLIFDTTASEEVWNFPVWKIDLDIQFINQDEQKGDMNINTSTITELVDYGIPKDYATQIVEYRESIGIIASLEELQTLEDYDEDFDMFFRIENNEITYYIQVKAYMTSDGVDADHIDIDENDPESYVENWAYFLFVNEKGLITGGEWKMQEVSLSSLEDYPEDHKDLKHPDFAWVPYRNPTTSSDQSSENPFLSYKNIRHFFGEEIERQ